MASLSRRDVLGLATLGGLALAAGVDAQTGKPRLNRSLKTKPGSAYDRHTEPLGTVRVAFIGMGARGPSHLASAMNCESVEIVAICDSHVPSAEKGQAMVTRAGRPAARLYTQGEKDYVRMLAECKLDAVFISTPWDWHVPMAVATMEAGCHALIEVPAAVTIDGCWQLVEVAERTGKHCMMLENVNYGQEELMVLNMVRRGLFGDLLHGEAAYIHDLRWQMKEIEHGTGSWRTLEYAKRNGNLYPTHGLGPVAHYMGINRGDRMDYLSSVSSPSKMRGLYAKQEFPEGHDRRKLKFVCGDINTTIVKTLQGRTIMIQWDEQLPRPYTRHNMIQGTNGVWAGFPARYTGDGVPNGPEEWMEGEDLAKLRQKYDHPLWKKLQVEAKAHGGHGGMDFIMVWRIIYCLRNGLPLDQDVYDAASWSCISPLSEWSVANRSQSIDIPDFTRGHFAQMRPVNLNN
ncbi:MAG: Gfo/Idh/MocA family oxidoreductase [Chthonomonas sp.]|nr:Gfo/Idh/MocA family oxidoreductase [Chthonomonas sp.]